MSIIPCNRDPKLRKLIEEFAETLKTESHNLGDHGLSESDFYQGGVFRGAIERIRGQFSATMREKREFVRLILSYMQDEGFITDWSSAGESNRHDYSVTLTSGKVAAIELKGCLDGNNTNIFERPPHAQEFILWSVCTNSGADPQHNTWSGIHTRLSAEIIDRSQIVDGLIVWDWLCGTVARPCPKISDESDRSTEIGQYVLPPPCIYVFPGTVPSTRNNPNPSPQKLKDVGILQAFHDCFSGEDSEINFVDFLVENKGPELLRTTRVTRNGQVVRKSDGTPIRRS